MIDEQPPRGYDGSGTRGVEPRDKTSIGARTDRPQGFQIRRVAHPGSGDTAGPGYDAMTFSVVELGIAWSVGAASGSIPARSDLFTRIATRAMTRARNAIPAETT